MTITKLSESTIAALFTKCSFEIPHNEMIFFGIRGCLQVDIHDRDLKDRHMIRIVDPDYRHLRCTLGQWLPGQGIALYPGSTVPWAGYVQTQVNMLTKGLYSYKKGAHSIGKPGQHEAFRQHGFFPVWRTLNDTSFDLHDNIDSADGIVWDNLHAAWRSSVEEEGYASAGCQVVAGYPNAPKRDKLNSGPWQYFYKRAYDISNQNVFAYALFSGMEVLTAAELGADMVGVSLRYGSSGWAVKKLQGSLKAAGYDCGDVDGNFGRQTLRALLAFQRKEISERADDGIVGPITSEALGLA